MRDTQEYIVVIDSKSNYFTSFQELSEFLACELGVELINKELFNENVDTMYDDPRIIPLARELGWAPKHIF